MSNEPAPDLGALFERSISVEELAAEDPTVRCRLDAQPRDSLLQVLFARLARRLGFRYRGGQS